MPANEQTVTVLAVDDLTELLVLINPSASTHIERVDSFWREQFHKLFALHEHHFSVSDVVVGFGHVLGTILIEDVCLHEVCIEVDTLFLCHSSRTDSKQDDDEVFTHCE